jgi:acetyl esterase/lipase
LAVRIIFTRQLMQIPNNKAAIMTVICSSFFSVYFLLSLFAGSFPTQIIAQGRRHGSSAASQETVSRNCYDPADSNLIRLWPGRAPGAIGDDPCRDIPYLRVFASSSEMRGPKPVILIIPGGGYDHLSDTKEQTPVAEHFVKDLHVTAIVLYYRLVQKDGTYRYPVPMWDGQRAIKLIRSRAAELGIDPKRVAVFGFSAGGHLASTLALHSATDFDLPLHDSMDTESGRPDLLGLGYPVISMDPTDVPPSGSYHNLLNGFRGAELQHLQTYLSGEKNITKRTPPVFLFEGLDDARISPQNSVLFVDALRQADRPVEAHFFPHGEHGDGLAEGIPGEGEWPEMFHRWLISQDFVER